MGVEGSPGTTVTHPHWGHVSLAHTWADHADSLTVPTYMNSLAHMPGLEITPATNTDTQAWGGGGHHTHAAGAQTATVAQDSRHKPAETREAWHAHCFWFMLASDCLVATGQRLIPYSLT